MYQVHWSKDYEVKVFYSFQFARLLMIIVLSNLFVSWSLSKFDLASGLGLHTEVVLVSHIGVSLLACVFMLHNENKSESLLVIPSVGINLTQVNRLGQVQTEFFPRKLIEDVVLVEAIVMHCQAMMECGQKLITYLVILYHDSPASDMNIRPIFLKSRLKIEELKSIYQKVQRNLKFTSSGKKS
ncbi:phosphatidylinositol N-acetylglucosaminyltransferase subunit H-like isoform X1 [Crassostrea virginica]